ncbi:AAA family ATPase [Nocardia transvalensis]|uniref:AAA family ATPase n=1 Tax=Nocardia transvalensis TaxID=37333 RepID=UPI001894D72B|nr:AAA family ATPase [Nocardia transvalensis]MBF6331867.1 AAA family ATPase [Nocardia transvalensis]
MDWDGLGAQLDAVSRQYAQRHGFQRTPEWLVLKIAEEAGELVQQFLAATGQGRSRGKSPAELNDSVDNEIADLLGHTILLAHHRGTDLQTALDRKWLRRITTGELSQSQLSSCPASDGTAAVMRNLPQVTDTMRVFETDDSTPVHATWNDDGDAVRTVLSASVMEALADCARRLDGRGLIVLCGFPGSGKSTAARYLAAVTGAMVLDKDAFAPGLESAVMTRLTGNPDDRDSDAYKSVVAPHVYDGLIRMATTVAARIPVIVDAPFLSLIQAAGDAGERFTDHLKSRVGAPQSLPVITVWVDSAAEQIRARMTIRGADRDVSKLADWPAYESAVLTGGLRETAHALVDSVIRN